MVLDDALLIILSRRERTEWGLEKLYNNITENLFYCKREFLYWSGYPMFFALLATMHFHFFLAPILFLHIDSNRLTISSPHHCRGLSIDLFRSLCCHSTTPRVHLLSEMLWYVHSSETTGFNTLWSHLPLHSAFEFFVSEVLTQLYS